MKTIKRIGIFSLCLLILTTLLTFGAAAEVDPVDYLVRDEYYQETDFRVTLLETLDELAASGTESLLIDVRELAEAECFEIVIREGWEETVYAAIYRIEGVFYYLNYVNLGNQHFDADGNFSYRSGEVVLTNAETYRSAIKAALLPLAESVPDVIEVSSDTGYVSAVIFWIGIVLLGFVAPVPFLVLGILLSRSQRRGCPRYWRILTYIALVWIALAAVLTVLLRLA